MSIRCILKVTKAVADWGPGTIAAGKARNASPANLFCQHCPSIRYILNVIKAVVIWYPGVVAAGEAQECVFS